MSSGGAPAAAQAAANQPLQMAARVYKMDKLTGPNYLAWRVQMEMCLKRLDLWGVVSGTEPDPGNANAATQDAWKVKDHSTQTKIVLHLSDKQVQLIRLVTTSKEMWDFLKREYEHTDLPSQVTLLKRLINLEMKDEQSADTFVDDWQTLLDNAVISGVVIPETLQTMLLLAALPSTWRSFITTKSSRSSVPASQSSVKPMAMAIRMGKNARRFPQRSGNTSQSLGQSSQFKQQTYNNNSRNSFNPGNKNFISNSSFRGIQCHYCHKNGHMEKDCRSKQRDLGRRPRAQARVAHMQEKPHSGSDEADTMQLFNVTIYTRQHEDDEWYFDTGATHHMTFKKNWLTDYQHLNHPLEVRLGDDSFRYAEGFGKLIIHLPQGNNTSIDKVYYVPRLTRNLLSVSEATKNGSTITFCHSSCIFNATLTSGQRISLICHQRGRLYPLGVTTGPAQANNAIAQTTSQSETLKWHYRFGHPNVQTLREMQKQNMVDGLNFQISPIDVCEGCLYGKFKQIPYTRSSTKTQKPLQLIHSDLCGPMPTRSLTGSQYFLTFIDDHTHFTIVSFLKTKSEVLSHFIAYKTFVENQMSQKIQAIRTDNGGEYISKYFIAYCQHHGIQHQLTVPYHPQQNGKAERKNGTLMAATRSMMKVASLSNAYWEEAVATACYTQNRLSTKTLNKNSL